MPLAPPTVLREELPNRPPKKEEVKSSIGQEALQFKDGDQPWECVRRVLEWALGEGANLEGCFLHGRRGRVGVHLPRLHAAGCYPHTWPFPLTLAGVQAAQRAAQELYASGPESRERLLREALEQGASRRGKRPAEEAEAAEEEAPGAKRHEQAQPRGCAQKPESAGGERARGAGGAEAAAAPADALQQRAAAVQQHRTGLALQRLRGDTPADNSGKQRILQLACAARRGCPLLQVGRCLACACVQVPQPAGGAHHSVMLLYVLLQPAAPCMPSWLRRAAPCRAGLAGALG